MEKQEVEFIYGTKKNSFKFQETDLLRELQELRINSGEIVNDADLLDNLHHHF